MVMFPAEWLTIAECVYDMNKLRQKCQFFERTTELVSGCARLRLTRMKSSIRLLVQALLAVALSSIIVGCSGAFKPTALIFTRSGGFAGFDDRLTVTADRKATLTRKNARTEFVVDAQVWDQLTLQLEAARFSQLDHEYLPVNTCCDMFTYTLTYQSHGVKTMDTSVPETLQPVIDLLNGLIDTNTMP